MIEAKDLLKQFGEKTAVDIPSFVINDGDVLGLVGNNGAGKTTFFRLILDLLDADRGSVTIDGANPAESEDWKAGVGAYIDEGFLIDFLTPEEYFEFVGKVNGMSRDQVAERLTVFERCMAGEVMGQKKYIRDFSAGNKQKVGIVSALLSRPKTVILDEPFNFLDPTSQLAMKYLLETYNKEQKATIIVSSHNITHTLDICTRITLLENGSIIKDYDKDYALLTSEIEAYFKGGVNI